MSNWVDESVCDDWTSRGGRNLWISDDPAELNRAARLCARCPVQAECAAYAEQTMRSHGPIYGVYAGRIYRDTRLSVDLTPEQEGSLLCACKDCDRHARECLSRVRTAVAN